MRRARLKIPLAFEVSTILAGTFDGAGCRSTIAGQILECLDANPGKRLFSVAPA